MKILFIFFALLLNYGCLNNKTATKQSTFKNFSPLLKTKTYGKLQTLNEQKINVQKFGTDLVLILPSHIFFQINSFQFNSEKTQTLYTMANILTENVADAKIYISGHSNNANSKKKLSLYQARQIASLLWYHGVNPNRMTVKGFGTKYPISKHSFNSSIQNSRVEIRIANVL